MKYWSGLYVETDKEKLMEGAELMLKVAKEVLASQTARQVTCCCSKMAKIERGVIVRGPGASVGFFSVTYDSLLSCVSGSCTFSCMICTALWPMGLPALSSG